MEADIRGPHWRSARGSNSFVAKVCTRATANSAVAMIWMVSGFTVGPSRAHGAARQSCKTCCTRPAAPKNWSVGDLRPQTAGGFDALTASSGTEMAVHRQ